MQWGYSGLIMGIYWIYFSLFITFQPQWESSDSLHSCLFRRSVYTQGLGCFAPPRKMAIYFWGPIAQLTGLQMFTEHVSIVREIIKIGTILMKINTIVVGPTQSKRVVLLVSEYR